MGTIDCVATRLGVYDGELYTQRTSRFFPLGVMFTKTSRYMTRPGGKKYFNVMGGGPDVLYSELPDSIQMRARKPAHQTEPIKPLTQLEVDTYAAIQAGVPFDEDFLKSTTAGVDTYMPASQAVRPASARGMSLGMIGVAVVLAIGYMILGRKR